MIYGELGMRILNSHPIGGLYQLWHSWRRNILHFIDDPLGWAASIILLMILMALLFGLLH